MEKQANGFSILSKLPDLVLVRKSEQEYTLLCQGNVFSDEQYSVSLDKSPSHEGQVVKLKADAGVSYVVLRWNMTFEEGTRFLADAFERTYGEHEWRFMVPERIMPWYFLTACQEQSAGYGVMVRANGFAFWQVDSEGVALWLDVRCGTKPVELGSQELEVATVVEIFSQEDENTFAMHKRFCHKMCKDPVLPKMPVYGSNNWYYAYGNTSHEKTVQDCDLIADLTQGLENRPFMVLDDGWQEFTTIAVTAGGPFTRGNHRFPDMKRLADEMKAKDVRPGLWVRPVLTHDRYVAKNWRLERDQNVLDTTVPEVLEHIGREIDNITGNWGYELVKYDFTTFDILGKYAWQMNFGLTEGDWAFHDRSKTSAQAIMLLYKTIFDHSNGAVLIGCNCIGHLGAGYFQLHRSGDDTSGLQWERTRKMGVNTLAFRLPQHNAFFAVDADCVGITEYVNWELNREWLRMVAYSGTPLFCSIAPGALNETGLDEVREAMRVNSVQADDAEPIDWMHTTCPTRWLINGKEEHFKLFGKAGVARVDDKGKIIAI